MTGDVIYGVLGFVVGALLVWLMMSLHLQAATADLRAEITMLKSERQGNQSQDAWIAKTSEVMKTTFEALAARTLRQTSSDFLGRAQTEMDHQRSAMEQLVSPLKDQVTSLGSAVRDIELKRENAFARLNQQLVNLVGTHQQLQSTTTELSQAMRSSSARGRWGELQLRRVVELADMLEYVDFVVQSTNDDNQRPDMVIRLPNQGELPVDSKAPMSAYLAALNATSDQDRKQKLGRHTQDVRGHIKTLNQRNYQGKLKNAPQFVVMFVPNEACLSAAFEFDPELLDFAMSQHVLIATPVTLLALLKSAAFGWQQQALALNANQIADKGRELYERAITFSKHLTNIRKNLSQTVDCFNQAAGSLETRFLPAARDLGKLVVSDRKIDPIEAIEQSPRLIQVNLPD